MGNFKFTEIQKQDDQQILINDTKRLAKFGACFPFPAGRPARLRPTALLSQRKKGKPEAATAVVELLMMGVRTPETH
jgi:hypothetical protein